MTGQELKVEIVKNGVECWRVAQAIGVSMEWLTRAFRLKTVPEDKLIKVLTALPQAIKEKEEFEKQYPRKKKENCIINNRMECINNNNER